MRLSRLQTILRSGALALASCLLLSPPSSWAQVVEVPIPGDPLRLDSGLVAGKTLTSGVRAYLGVPYAAPPVRDLRWRAPQPTAPWRGVYNADRKAPECIQPLRAHNLNHYFGEEASSEDCLYLNIWAAPDARPGAKLPVLVWIYGGGFTIGSSGMANYSGETVAGKGAVFVSLNYRVGAMGFLAHPELTAETPHKASGDYGLLDQVAALQWVRRNIAQFGGDPDNVTIMGQSAGAASASYLQSSPLAKGLFHKVVAMSGSAVGSNRTVDLKAGEASGLEFQAALKAKSLAEMRALPADRILAVQADCQLGCSGSVRVGPVVDGYFLPRPPREIFAAGQQNDTPILIGFTHDESSNALRAATTVAEYRLAAEQVYGPAAPQILRMYPVTDASQIRGQAGAAAREGGVQTVMRNWAIAQTKTGKAPAYLYMFSRVHPYAPGVTFADHNPATVGAYHTGDVPYWFGTFDAFNLFRTTRSWTPQDHELTELMQGALLSFARTGAPSVPGLTWPPYDRRNERLVEFGDSVRLVPINSRRLDVFLTLPVQPMLAPASGRPRD